MKKKDLIMVSLIVLFGLFIRLLLISHYDIGSYWDEGYFASATVSVMKSFESFFFPTLFEVGGKELFFAAFPGFPWINSIIPSIFGITTLTLRLVTVLFGTFSTVLFYLIISLLFSRKKAIFSSLVFVSMPILVAFSRVESPHVIEMFFFLLTTYLLILFQKKSDYRYLWFSTLSLAASILVHGWLSLPLILCAYLWVLVFSKVNKKKLLLGLSISFILAIIPLVLYINHASNYYLEHKDTINPFSKYDNIESAFYLETGYDYLGMKEFNIFQRLSPRYLGAGNLTLEYLFTGPNIVYLIMLLFGMLIVAARMIFEKSFRTNQGYWLFALLFFGFLPIHMAQRSYASHLIIAVPIISFFISESAFFISDILKNKILQRVFLSLLAIFFLSAPLIMILSGNEILYQTNYKIMGEYVKPLSENYTYSAIVRYSPTFSYYTHKIARTTDWMNKPISWFIENNQTRFVGVKTIPNDNTMKASDYDWVINNCVDISEKIGLPADSIHKLYDCKPDNTR